MALIPCKGCAEQISPKAVSCPKCGHPNEKASHLSGTTVVMILLGTVLFVWWMAAGSDKYVKKEMHKVETAVANDMVEQYNMAKRSGDKMQTCVQAGMVTAAYLQANDEPNYRTWERIQKTDCKAAGLPM